MKLFMELLQCYNPAVYGAHLARASRPSTSIFCGCGPQPSCWGIGTWNILKPILEHHIRQKNDVAVVTMNMLRLEHRKSSADDGWCPLCFSLLWSGQPLGVVSRAPKLPKLPTRRTLERFWRSHSSSSSILYGVTGRHGGEDKTFDKLI